MHDVSQFICTAHLLLSVVLLLDLPFFSLNYCSKQQEYVPDSANRMFFDRFVYGFELIYFLI